MLFVAILANIHNLGGSRTFAHGPLPDGQPFRTLACRNDLDEFAGAFFQQPKDARVGNDCCFADIDDLSQDLGQRLGRRQPMHDLEDLYQRFTGNLARIALR
jgi:hypothetical protein